MRCPQVAHWCYQGPTAAQGWRSKGSSGDLQMTLTDPTGLRDITKEAPKFRKLSSAAGITTHVLTDGEGSCVVQIHTDRMVLRLMPD